MPASSTSLSGRRAQAASNDERILAAARAVFVANPAAPIAEVAKLAGVGISALYRRFPSKEELLRQLCRDGLERYIAEVEAALADRGEPWAAFVAFMRRALDADTHSLTLRLAGTFVPTEELYAAGNRAHQLTWQLFERVRDTGAIRPDVESDDLALIFEQLAAINVGDEQRSRQLRHRYLALMLQALLMQAKPPLPGPPPSWQEIQRRWGPPSATGP